MTTRFRTTINGTPTDLNDLYVRKEIFAYGNLWTWGRNSNGQLGDNTQTSRSSPVQTVAGGTNWRQVSSGYTSRAAIKTDGTLWTWGRNSNGQLGDNTRTSRSSPVQTVAGGNDWRQVSCGYNTTAAIKTDGTLWLWGSNSRGRIGDNTNTSRSSPVQTVAGGNNWQQVSAGYQIAAIKTDGTLWMWGRNSYGELGDNTRTDRSSPVQTVAGGTDWKFISRGQGRTGAIKTDGTLWLWGDNPSGQLGDDTTTRRSSPVQTVAGGTNWRQVNCGGFSVSAIKTDGTLWTWGSNNRGQLGDNTTTNRSSPVQTVAGGTNWRQTAVGELSTYAIKTDGSLWAWGENDDGALGDDTITNRSSPVQTVAGGNNWRQIDSHFYVSTPIAIRDR